MPTIKKISKLTENKHLNLYQLDAVNKVGKNFHILWLPGQKRQRN